MVAPLLNLYLPNSCQNLPKIKSAGFIFCICLYLIVIKIHGFLKGNTPKYHFQDNKGNNFDWKALLFIAIIILLLLILLSF